MLRIGVDLGGTKIEVVVLDGEGKELFRKRIPTPREYIATLDAIESLVNEAESTLAQKGSVGVGIPRRIELKCSFCVAGVADQIIRLK